MAVATRGSLKRKKNEGELRQGKENLADVATLPEENRDEAYLPQSSKDVARTQSTSEHDTDIPQDVTETLDAETSEERRTTPEVVEMKDTVETTRGTNKRKSENAETPHTVRGSPPEQEDQEKTNEKGHSIEGNVR